MKIRAFLALLLACCLFSPVLAQTQPPAPPPVPQPQTPSNDKDDVVKITTNLVQVDAVVTKGGKAVTDLTAADFEIYEDGKKQAITSFAYISNVTAAPAQPIAEAKAKTSEIVPVTPVKRDVPRRTIALVVDDLGLSAESIAHVRRQLKKFIAEQMQPNDLVAVIRTGGQVGALQQFTNDRRILNRAVDQLRWNFCSRVGIYLFAPHTTMPVPSAAGNYSSDASDSGCSYNSYVSTMKILRFVLDAMGELPGRKSMVVLSDSMPIETQETDIAADSPVADASFPGSRNYSVALRKIAERAIRSSVVIYSVDTQGLATTGITAADSFSGGSRSTINQINTLISQRSLLAYNRRQGGQLIAEQTGGFQVKNSNSFKLDAIVEDQSGYYLIGYRPSDETFNRRFHHIKAKVKRSGMTLRTRFGFFGVTEEEANKSTRTVGDLTNLALMSPFGAQDINLDLTSFFANDKAAGTMIRSFVYIDANDMNFATVNGKRQTSFELHGVIIGDNGAVVEKVTRGATVTLVEEDYEQARRYGMNITLDMPVKRPGAYQVRIAVRDRNSSHIGSAGQFVAVPNLNNKRLAVSGVVLGTASRGLEIANPGNRRFAVNSDVHFAYLLYNMASEEGGLRSLVAQVKLFRDGKNVYTGPETPLSVANQTDPARVFASGSVHLPPNLEPGDYGLQVVVTEKNAKKPVSLVQWANFEIEK